MNRQKQAEMLVPCLRRNNMKYKYVWYVDTACDVITCRTLDDAIETAEKYIKQNYPDKFERLVESLYDQVEKNKDLEEFYVIDYEREYPFTVVSIDKGAFLERVNDECDAPTSSDIEDMAEQVANDLYVNKYYCVKIEALRDEFIKRFLDATDRMIKDYAEKTSWFED